jgi:hypothetical protein
MRGTLDKHTIGCPCLRQCMLHAAPQARRLLRLTSTLYSCGPKTSSLFPLTHFQGTSFILRPRRAHRQAVNNSTTLPCSITSKLKPRTPSPL